MPQPVLLFDLDGTLIDSEPGILQCLKETSLEYGVETQSDECLREFIGPPIGQALYKMLSLTNESDIPHAVATYRKYYSDHGVLNCSLYPGILELLDKMDGSQFEMFIVTSKAQIYAEQIAKHHRIAQFFRGIYGPELTGTQQLKSASIEQLLQDHHHSAVDCIMIGDRENDITAAKVHQMKTLAVLWGYGSREELTAAGASNFVSTPYELFELMHA